MSSGSTAPAGRLPTDPALHYRLHVFVCTNERPDGKRACGGSGAIPLQAYLKQRARELGLGGIRVNKAGCLDRCSQGPLLVVYPEGVWYGYSSQADLDEILTVHLRDGGRVERLMLDRAAPQTEVA